jgi:ABC transporter ATM
LLTACGPSSKQVRNVLYAAVTSKIIRFVSTDLIIVMKDGQVVEQGTHEELLRKAGLYYSMWVEQASDAVTAEQPVEVR